MYYTYILKSQRDNKLYIGRTNNIERRLAQHNQGRVRSTRHRTPFVLFRLEQYDTLSGSRSREDYLKSLKGGNALKKIINLPV